jgi:iron complex outermembrane recepter protein
VKEFRKHPLHAKSLFGIGRSAAFAAGLIAMVGTSAQAESPADTSQAAQPASPGTPGPQLEEVVVSGIRASLERAMDIKRDADVVVDSISAEDIGKFPDANVAESLQRITGVAIDRNEAGEGQKVTIRGFGPTFNTVLVNGRTLPTQTGDRSFNFDVLPAELINGADVYKTSAASQIDGGIGGSMNLHTPRPLDLKHFKAIVSAKGEYDELSGKAAPQGFLLLSDTFLDGTFGALMSLSAQETHARTNQVLTGNWVSTDFPLLPGDPHGYMPQQLDVQTIESVRKRVGATGVLQWRPNDQLLMTLDGLYDSYKIHSETNAVGHYFDSSQIASGTLDPNGVLTSFTTTSNAHTDFIHEHGNDTLRTPDTLKAIGLNANWSSSNDRLNLTFDASRATNVAAGSVDPRYFTVAGFNNVVTYTGNGGAGLPSISTSGVPSLGIPANAFTDPNLPMAHFAKQEAHDDTDTINEGRLDATWKVQASVLQDLRFGLYYQDRNLKAIDEQTGGSAYCTYCGYNIHMPASLFSAYNAGSGFGGSYGGKFPTQWLTYNPGQYFAYLTSPAALAAEDAATGNPPGTAARTLTGGGANGYLPVPNSSTYENKEKISAFYLQADFNGTLSGRPWSANLGGRYVRTQEASFGYSKVLLDLLPVPNDPTIYNPIYAANGQQLFVSASHTYNNFLPSFNFRINLTDELIARVAASRSLTRPNLSDMRPTIGYDVLRPGELQASGGNPDLKPYLSDNYDLSLEWYYNRSGYVSVGAFRKNISNFVVSEYVPLSVSIANSSHLAVFPNNTATFLFNTPTNAKSAFAEGLEVAVQHTFNYLPAPFDGLGFNANATFMHSNAVMDAANTNQTFALTGLGNSQNFIVFYDKGPAGLRVAYNHRDAFLQSTAPTVHTKPYGQLDAQASYKVAENVLLLLEGSNLTGAVVQQYDRYLNEFVNLENYGRRYALGVRVDF